MGLIRYFKFMGSCANYAMGHIRRRDGGLKTAIDEIKQMIVTVYPTNKKAYDDAKKPSRMEDMDTVMETRIPGF